MAHSCSYCRLASLLEEDIFPKTRAACNPSMSSVISPRRSSRCCVATTIIGTTKTPKIWRRKQQQEDRPFLSDSCSSKLPLPSTQQSMEALQPHHLSQLALVSCYLTHDAKQNVPPIAFWSVDGHQLLWFNDSFAQLLEYPVELLQNGFRISTVGIVDDRNRIVRLQEGGNNALKDLYSFHRLVRSGGARYLQMYFSFLSGKGNVKHLQVSLIAYNDSIQWVCAEMNDQSSSEVEKPLNVVTMTEWKEYVAPKRKAHLLAENSF